MLTIIPHQLEAAQPLIFGGQILNHSPAAIAAAVFHQDNFKGISQLGQFSRQFFDHQADAALTAIYWYYNGDGRHSRLRRLTFETGLQHAHRAKSYLAIMLRAPR